MLHHGETHRYFPIPIFAHHRDISMCNFTNLCQLSLVNTAYSRQYGRYSPKIAIESLSEHGELGGLCNSQSNQALSRYDHSDFF
jgi:hypothetical protein